MENILRSFRLDGEKEDLAKVIENVDRGVEYKGTNLWILVFAIFIASLGLNVNSTAVVIGAMLISPLMGPIIGLGLGMAINDFQLLRKSLFNYVFALVVGLITSTIYFSLSPLSDASSEILSRTSPNIYDVLIALFGGFAGMLAVSSRNKGNVIPGVAIATALMPPLCTAGYGIANGNLAYLSGALYLFIINTVFISLSTLITAKYLKFPIKALAEKSDELVARRVMWGVTLLTLLPSVYFGYDIVVQSQFRRRADKFVDAEAVFPNDYLLKKTIDSPSRTIRLTYGGEFIPEAKIDELKAKMPTYQLSDAKLEIRQGFSYVKGDQENEQEKQLTNVINEKEKQLQALKDKVAASDAEKELGKQVFNELRVQYPTIQAVILQQVARTNEKGQTLVWIADIGSSPSIPEREREKIKEWLITRINAEKILMNFAPYPRPTPEPSPTSVPSENQP